jgi:hypothetical protein
MKGFFFLIAAFLFSCANQNAEGDYYFPLKDFMVEKTNCFVNKNDTTEKSYWKMKTIISGKDTLLQTRVYDNDWRIVDSCTERVSNGNSEFISYTLFDYADGNKVQLNTTLLKSNVFKRDQHNGESIEWKVSFKDPRSIGKSELTRTRSLISTDAKKKIFFDKMLYANITTGAHYQYESTKIYQKGKGLVSYKMVLPDGTEKNYELVSSK